MNKQRLVREFMDRTPQSSASDTPTIPSIEVCELRAKLILEEALEFIRAQGLNISNYNHDVNINSLKVYNSVTREPDIVKTADALADLLYVVYGACVSWGIMIDPVFGAVHEANMRKFGPGSYQREDGKWMKPPDWQPPDLLSVLKAQGYASNEA